MSMTLGSLFDGSGGFPLAARMTGRIRPVWCSEIEPYCVRVTAKNFPEMKQYGDITKMNGAEIEPVDIITFGSPCQDLSVAGKRAGMKHTEQGDDETTRSGLFYEAIRVIKEMRNATDGQYPNLIIWENVCGAFSSNNGEDFWTVLKEIYGIAYEELCIPRLESWTKSGEILADRCSIAWRTMDAQYWGVPQMRRRIFLVADFSGKGRSSKILFERQGLSRNFSEIREERQKVAADSGRGIAVAMQERNGKAGGGKGVLIQKDKAMTLDCGNSQFIAANLYNGEVHSNMTTLSGGCNEKNRVICMQMSSPDVTPRMYEEITPTLKTQGDTVGSNLAVFESSSGGVKETDVLPTIDTTGYKKIHSNQGGAIVFENHSQDSRYRQREVINGISGHMGTGGNNQPFVVDLGDNDG